MTAGEYRLRVRYAKQGRLRWLSHLEVVHAIERMIRRAKVSYAVTQGFSPHLKAAFGPALPVGTGGENEYFDVWLTRYTDAQEVVRSFQRVSAADLAPVEGRYIAGNSPSLTAMLTIARYEVRLGGEEIDQKKVHEALTQLVSHGEFEIEHKGKKKVFDLARSVPEDARVSERDGRVAIDLTVRMGPEGSLRPERLVRAALDAAGLSASSVRTTRCHLLFESDEGDWSRPM